MDSIRYGSPTLGRLETPSPPQCPIRYHSHPVRTTRFACGPVNGRTPGEPATHLIPAARSDYSAADLTDRARSTVIRSICSSPIRIGSDHISVPSLASSHPVIRKLL